MDGISQKRFLCLTPPSEADNRSAQARVLDALRLDDRNGGDLLMLFYESEIVRGEPQTVECRALDWTLPKDVAAYDLAPADRLFLQRQPELFAVR